MSRPRFALVNPAWRFDGSVYFGCKSPHLPLELGYSKALLEEQGSEAHLVDAHLEGLDDEALLTRIRDIEPHILVIATAPSYLFWRCPPPELASPMRTASLLRNEAQVLVAVGPHASLTPGATLAKLNADLAVLGECEEVLPEIAQGWAHGWDQVTSVARRVRGCVTRQGAPRETNLWELPPLAWPEKLLQRHTHHHHRFDATPQGPGAEVEASRGCPYHCSFCAKSHFRGRYRVRRLASLLAEIDALLGMGARYLYFIDETFFPDEELLLALAERGTPFGVQTRIDLWTPESLRLLGRAGCVSVEAGVESVSEAGRRALSKRCALSTLEIERLLVLAKDHVPFVQANLLAVQADGHETIAAWRERLLAQGVWANDPVPLFPYPGSAEYQNRFGPEDEQAWERAHDHYLLANAHLSDLQAERPLPLKALEDQPQTPGARP